MKCQISLEVADLTTLQNIVNSLKSFNAVAKVRMDVTVIKATN